MVSHRQELKGHGATARLVQALQACFPGGLVPSAPELGDDYATTLSVLRGRFHLSVPGPRDLELPAPSHCGICHIVASTEALSGTFPAAPVGLVPRIDLTDHLRAPDPLEDAVRRLFRPVGGLAFGTHDRACSPNLALLAA